ncbi:acyl-homoserine-lactone synthase [Agrobacterium tumefaciens]|uniref:Acyl-homoserine-lactone synthase n=1 Tax=Agrobacterium tumefaciens TaxID=358 RepID=A0AA44FCP9_AGRTU|nr:acyl-homoserine-lactone synthase [Agrobacterium tumefaciens]NTB87821.1 GNAT family N-acetyltransferase [Agrobacterium tumefaciens]NTC32091.1 GNAT family N-acetyltransferase [Agrobacterium tumefaciens]
MLVHVITSSNSALYANELSELFRIRHKIYVEEKGWREPSPDGMECDQFDTEHAVHLVGIQDGRIIAGSRFLPTTQPHLLSEIFPHLCTRPGVLRHERAAEWTRGFIIPEFREKAGLTIKAQFCAAVMEYCLNQGIEQIGGIQEIYWLPLWKRFGWRVNVIGEAAEIDGVLCVPAYFEVSVDALEGVRRRANLSSSNLIERGRLEPFVPVQAPAFDATIFSAV